MGDKSMEEDASCSDAMEDEGMEEDASCSDASYSDATDNDASCSDATEERPSGGPPGQNIAPEEAAPYRGIFSHIYRTN